MKIVLISDIHIHGSDDPLYRSLLTLIEKEVGPRDTLVLAGDIFDFFVGDQPVLVRRYEAFFRLLRKKAEQGMRIDYIEGNHDFHLTALFAKTFSGLTNVQVHAAEVALVTAGGGRLYVSHGDLVDTEDRGYLLLRAFFRSDFTRLAAYLFPDRLVEWIGAQSSIASQKRGPRLPAAQGEERLQKLRAKYHAAAEAKLREGFAGVVMGHCHDLDGRDFALDGRTGQYLNIGYPRAHRSYVVFSDENGLERKPLP